MSDVLQQPTVTLLSGGAPVAQAVHPAAHLSAAERKQEVLKTAQQILERTTDWASFYREILGVEGIVRKLFPTVDAQSEFEVSDEFFRIQQMLAKLREKGDGEGDGKEPTRVITVRLPKSLHESLRAEAEGRHTSMNKLCITKLLQYIDGQLIPQE